MKMVNDRQAAKLMGMKVQTLRNWRHIGKGPTYNKLGRLVMYEVENLIEFIRSRRIKP